MKFMLLILALGITVLFFFIVLIAAVFPYLWFKDYLHLQEVEKQEIEERRSQEIVNGGESKSRFQGFRTVSEQVALFAFNWLPFLAVEIIWVRFIWRIVMDVIYPRVMDLIPL